MMPIRELITAAKIVDRVKWLGDAIRQDFESKPVTMVSVLKGSFIFAADLFRSVNRPDVAVDFLGTSSYAEGTESTGVVRITHDLSKPVGVRGRSSNNDLCRSMLGWAPNISLEAGLRATYPWIASEVERRRRT